VSIVVSLPQSAPSPDRAAELADVRARYQWDYDYLRPIPFLKVHGVQDTGVLALADVVIGPPATPWSRPRRRLGTPDSPTASWPSSSHSRRCCGSPPRPICAILDNLPCQSGPDRDFFGRTLGEETARQRYLPAPRALLYRHDDGQLLLVAIQLGQTEADEVFTPADDAELWHRIKLLYAVADFNHHELSTHLLSVHFFRGKTGTQETLNIAMLYCAASAPDESKVDDSLRTPPLVDLSGHNLTVLPDLSSWSRLGGLKLWSNRLTSLPEWLVTIEHLETLDISFNPGLGLPEILARMPALQSLTSRNLELSELPEALPDSIGNLSSLRRLFTMNVPLVALPESLFALQSLETLQLYNTQLEWIPAAIGQLTSLKSVTLYGKAITALPEEIGLLTALTELHLDVNELTVLPDTLGALQALETLDLADNRFTGVKKLSAWIKATLPRAKHPRKHKAIASVRR
jgi:hypothetical protein